MISSSSAISKWIRGLFLPSDRFVNSFSNVCEFLWSLFPWIIKIFWYKVNSYFGELHVLEFILVIEQFRIFVKFCYRAPNYHWPSLLKLFTDMFCYSNKLFFPVSTALVISALSLGPRWNPGMLLHYTV